MQHRLRVRHAHELSVEVEIPVQPPFGFRFVDLSRHQDVGGVMVALGLNQAGVEARQFIVAPGKFAREHLKLLATPPLDQRAAQQVVDDLMPRAGADALHQTGDPRTAPRFGEGDAAPLEQVEHEPEVLEFLDGNGVQLVEPVEEHAVFLQHERGGGGLAFKVRVVHQHGGQVRQHLGQPVGRNLLAEHQHDPCLPSRAKRASCNPTQLPPA